MAVSVIIYTLPNCLVCEKLVKTVLTLQSTGKLSSLNIEITILGYEGTPPVYAANVKPRVYPTVIAFRDELPSLGWEGFAALAPESIEEEIVMEALADAAALSAS